MSYNRFNNTSANDVRDQTATQRPTRTILNFEQEDDNDKVVRESLLRESGHMTRSEHLLDEQFDLAIKTRENLVNQRLTINSMREGYNNITDRFSSVNQLIKKIRLRKRRDTIIVAIVFSICLGILLYNLLL